MSRPSGSSRPAATRRMESRLRLPSPQKGEREHRLSPFTSPSRVSVRFVRCACSSRRSRSRSWPLSPTGRRAPPMATTLARGHGRGRSRAHRRPVVGRRRPQRPERSARLLPRRRRDRPAPVDFSRRSLRRRTPAALVRARVVRVRISMQRQPQVRPARRSGIEGCDPTCASAAAWAAQRGRELRGRRAMAGAGLGGRDELQVRIEFRDVCPRPGVASAEGTACRCSRRLPASRRRRRRAGTRPNAPAISVSVVERAILVMTGLVESDGGAVRRPTRRSDVHAMTDDVDRLLHGQLAVPLRRQQRAAMRMDSAQCSSHCPHDATSNSPRARTSRSCTAPRTRRN